MNKRRARRAGAALDGRRKPRPRPTPKWLQDPARLDAVAHSRCMMVLSVLSGETPVSEAIAQAKISRGTYYQLETRAVKAMLTALNPLTAAKRRAPADLSATRIQALMERVRSLEQDKRRMKRLVLMAKKAKWPDTLQERLARKRLRARLGLSPSGRSASRASATTTAPRAPSPSTPTNVGATTS
jgi:hypothetical protein